MELFGKEWKVEFVKTPVGILMMINIVLSMLSWILMSSWVGETPREFNQTIDGQVAFFLIVTLATFIFFVVIFLMHMREFKSPILMLLICAALGLVILIAGALIYTKAKNKNIPCTVWMCRLLDATAAFGFLCTISLVIEAFFHYRDWNNQLNAKKAQPETAE